MTTETLPAAPAVAEPTTPIRPSEALRLGRLLRPRRWDGALFEGTDGACALGAIAVGAGITEPGDDYEGFGDRWPEMDELVLYPGKGGYWYEWSVTDTIHGLNDWDKWSDDQIVAWLESLGL